MKSLVDQRRCFDCGRSERETLFPGPRKAYGKRDRCQGCEADPPVWNAERQALWCDELARQASVRINRRGPGRVSRYAKPRSSPVANAAQNERESR